MLIKNFKLLNLKFFNQVGFKERMLYVLLLNRSVKIFKISERAKLLSAGAHI